MEKTVGENGGGEWVGDLKESGRGRACGEEWGEVRECKRNINILTILNVIVNRIILKSREEVNYGAQESETGRTRAWLGLIWSEHIIFQSKLKLSQQVIVFWELLIRFKIVDIGLWKILIKIFFNNTQQAITGWGCARGSSMSTQINSKYDIMVQLFLSNCFGNYLE